MHDAIAARRPRFFFAYASLSDFASPRILIRRRRYRLRRPFSLQLYDAGESLYRRITMPLDELILASKTPADFKYLISRWRRPTRAYRSMLAVRR